MRKDEKGYVMSGIGFLLLIPVIILIPLALSVQDQSADIPTTFVKSDTVFQTLKSIQNDINDKANNLKNSISKKTFNDPSDLAKCISVFYNGTTEDVYKDTYVGTVDSISISPASSNHLVMDSNSGIIPLKNGIEITYSYVNKTTLGTIGNNNTVYVYNMNITANMNMDIKKLNVGNHQNFNVAYTPVIFYINNNTNTATFFSNLQNILESYNICL
ncbi:hypothetical protein [Methanobacterium oryzae]|uniref:hypothetical protein n=1 Tax=Methanobacterium oryzae TaxID=69540 RepID=UPI003D25C08D